MPKSLVFTDPHEPLVATSETRIMSLAFAVICSVACAGDDMRYGLKGEKAMQFVSTQVCRAVIDLYPSAMDALADLMRLAVQRGLRLSADLDPTAKEVLQ